MTESTSAEAAREVRVKVRTGSPLAEVFLIDHTFALVRRSVGDLETTVKPGVYKVKAKLADAQTERLVLCEADSEIDLSADLRVRSPAPLATTGRSLTQRSRRARMLASAGRDSDLGPAKTMLMTTRSRGHMAAPEAALYDAAGVPAGLRSITETPGWGVSGGEPGSYFLRWRGAAGVEVEQTIQTVAGWQTQIFLIQEVSGTAPDLCATRVSVLMSPNGFEPESSELRRTEEARTALANERKVATEELESLIEQADSPMLSLFGAHLMLLTRDPSRNQARARPTAATRFDRKRFARVVDRLREILGPDHPDVTALSTQLSRTSRSRLHPVGAPPMLYRSWLLLLEASNDAPELVGRGVWSRAVVPMPLYPFLIWATHVPDAVTEIEETLTRALAEGGDEKARRTLTGRLLVPRAIVDEVAARP